MPALDDEGGGADFGLKEASERPVDRGPALPSLTGGASYEGLNPPRPEEAKRAIPVGLIVAGTALVIAGLIVGAVLLNRSAGKSNVIVTRTDGETSVETPSGGTPSTPSTPSNPDTPGTPAASRAPATPPPPPPNLEEVLAAEEPDYVPFKEQMTKLGAELNEYLKQNDGLYPEGVQQLAAARKLEMPIVMGGARCPCRVAGTMADVGKGPFIINDRIFRDRAGNRRQLVIDTAGRMESLDPGEVDRRTRLGLGGCEGYPIVGMRRAKYGQLPGPYFHWTVNTQAEPIDQARVRMRNLQGAVLAYADAHKGALPVGADVLATSDLGFDKDDLHSSHAPDMPVTMVTPATGACRQILAFDPVPYNVGGRNKFIAISRDSLYIIDEPNFAEALYRDTLPMPQFVRRPIDPSDSPRLKAEKNLWNLRCALQAYAGNHNGEYPVTLAELKGSGLLNDPAELSPPGRPKEIYRYVPGYTFRSPHACVVLFDPTTYDVGPTKVTIGATMASDLLYSSSAAVMRQTVRNQVNADKSRTKENMAVVQWALLPRAALPASHPLNDLCDEIRVLENRGRVSYIGVTFGPPAATTADAGYLNWKTLQDKRFNNAIVAPGMASTNWYSANGWCLSLQTTVSFGRSGAYWLYSSEWEEDGTTRETYFNLLGGAVAAPDFKERPHKYLENPTPNALARMAWELLPDGMIPDSHPLKRICPANTKPLMRGKEEMGWIGVAFGNRAKSMEDPVFRSMAMNHERQFKELLTKLGATPGQMILVERNGSIFRGLRSADVANKSVVSFVAGVQDGYAVIYWYVGKYADMAEQSIIGGAPFPGSK